MAADEGQRKLTAILAADVAGYTRLMADDDRETVRTLTQYREVFSQHIEPRQGRIVDTAGDSVLATFESVIEAVEAAVEVQRVLAERNKDVSSHRQMHFRIGVNSGDIIVREDDSVYGDGVNVAARLESLAEPGGIMVSEDVYKYVEGKIDVGLADAGEHEVKNVAKPVRAYRVVLDGSEPVSTTAQPISKSLRRPKVIAGLAAALAIVIGLAVWGVTLRVEVPQMVKTDGTPTDDPVLAMPTGPAIAVLPFENLSGDSEQEYFADGVTEDIISRLLRFDAIRVIGRNSTFQYKENRQDVRDIGRTLGARYVLDGSIRRAPGQIRITARLLDANDGSSLWADDHDISEDVATLFETQDQITGEIAGAIASTGGVLFGDQISEIATQRPKKLESYDCVLMAHEYARVLTPESHEAARECLERVVEVEPGYAEAWAFLAAMYNDEILGFNPRKDGPSAFDRMKKAAQRAITIDPNNTRGHKWLSITNYWNRDAEALLQGAKETIELNPNDGSIYADLGVYLWHAGWTEIAFEMMRKAIALTPNAPRWYFQTPSIHYYRMGDYEEALSWARKGEEAGNFISYSILAISLGQLNRREEAAATVVKLLEIMPNFASDIDLFYEPWAWAFPEERDHWKEGLEKAGLFDEPEAPSRPVIAVLPFDNMSGDPEQDYFADGITEDIITRLSQFPDILVLGRNTTFQFKGQAVDIPTIAEKLKADYVVEGSIRRGGDTVRVTAQLLSADGGTHLWAETFDRALDPENIFAIQDEITSTVAARVGDLHGAVSQAEYERTARQPLAQLSSYECVLRYFELMRLIDEETHALVRDCLEDVIAAEPKNSLILAYLSDVYLMEISSGFNPTPDSSTKKALSVAKKAVRLDPTNGYAHNLLGWILYLMGDVDRGIRETEEALRLAPNHSEVVGAAATVFSNTGNYDRAMELMEKVRKINPMYSPWINWVPANYHTFHREHDEALAWLERTGGDYFPAYHIRIASERCALGDIERGKASLAKALEMDPDYAERYWPEIRFWWKGKGLYPLAEIVGEGLEACGWDVPPDPGPEAFATSQ